jgi:hypothetical protein
MMDGMEKSDVSESWIGLAVRARIRTRRGGQYLALGTLVRVNEEGIELMTDSRWGEASDRPGVRLYPWERVVSVEPL